MAAHYLVGKWTLKGVLFGGRISKFGEMIWFPIVICVSSLQKGVALLPFNEFCSRKKIFSFSENYTSSLSG